jgi:hypothetical protein
MKEPVKEVLWESAHVKLVSLASGASCLVVEGMQLNDFVEEHLWDHFEYEATSVEMERPASIPVYYNYVPDDVPAARVIDLLNELDPTELEQAFNRK